MLRRYAPGQRGGETPPVTASRKLTVLSAGYSLVPIGPDAVGGSEQILAALDRALVAHGHRSIVAGCAGSV